MKMFFLVFFVVVVFLFFLFFSFSGVEKIAFLPRVLKIAKFRFEVVKNEVFLVVILRNLSDKRLVTKLMAVTSVYVFEKNEQ